MTSESAMRDVLCGTPLEGRELIKLPILDTGEVAYAVRIAAPEVESMWRVARALLHKTRRWPVATMSWGGGATWNENFASADLFSRFYYEEAPEAVDVTPRGLLRLADTVDVDAFVEQLSKKHDGYFDAKNASAFELEATQMACGVHPTLEELEHATLGGKRVTTHLELDQWLMQWETSRGGPKDPSIGRQPWFEEEPCALLFLPVQEPWDTLAYLNWFGTSDPGTQYFIALGRRWNQQYGAELVAHYGTMLQCLVARPPQTQSEAWRLAREHDLAAPCTMALPGISLRHYALGLVGHDRWFLHERP